MRFVSRAISYLFHPLFAPIAGGLAYFSITPKYSTLADFGGNMLPIFILTVLIPLIAFFILRNMGLAHSLIAPKGKERQYALILGIALLLLILLKVIPSHYIPELYYYFVGLLGAAMACLLMSLLKFKASIQVAAVGSVLMYLVLLSIHFEKNITLGIGAMVLCSGLVATAKLQLKQHNAMEVLLGFVVGIICQLLTVKYWI